VFEKGSGIPQDVSAVDSHVLSDGQRSLIVQPP
jgi:hypothetical protein